MTAPEKYSKGVRFLHWLMAAVLVGSVYTGWQLEEPGNRVTSLHFGLGISIALLILLRIWARLGSTVPPFPDGLAAWEARVAHAAHMALYGTLVMMPALGFLAATTRAEGATLWGLPLPSVLGRDKVLHEAIAGAHGLVANILILVTLLHIAGALKHRLFDKPENNVLPRIL